MSGGGGESEEKTLPPSAQKLRKAREKGQVVTSKETLSSLGSLAVLLYLFARKDAIWRDLQTLFRFEPVPGLSFLQDLQERAGVAMDLGIAIVVPILALVIALTVLGGVTISGGPVFSFDPILPRFDKLNPASGFKKLFGKTAWLRLLMHIVRVSAIAALLVVMLSGQIGALIPTPPCGLGCIGRAVDALLVPLLVGLTAILTLAGLMDYLVQRGDFIRQQKMSITERKREHKDLEGNPQLKGAMRQTQRDMVESPTGIAQATLILRDGARALVAVRYVAGDMPAPMVVARARGSGPVGRAIRARMDLLAVDDPGAVAALEGVAVGDWIASDDQVAAVVPHLH